mgnify:CR=1 FL=1
MQQLNDVSVLATLFLFPPAVFFLMLCTVGFLISLFIVAVLFHCCLQDFAEGWVDMNHVTELGDGSVLAHQHTDFLHDVSSMSAIAVQTDVLTTAKLEGLAEGRVEGEAKGRAEERALAQKEKLESARSLIENGVPIDVIAKSLGLTSEEIKELSSQRD